MPTGPLDMSKDPDRYRPDGPVEDLSIVPGLGASGRPLDMSQDPDRYHPDLPAQSGPLDLSQDPDRFVPAPKTIRIAPTGEASKRRALGRGKDKRTLVDLVGTERSYSDEVDPWSWLFGLLMVVGFLALVAFLFGSVLSA